MPPSILQVFVQLARRECSVPAARPPPLQSLKGQRVVRQATFLWVSAQSYRAQCPKRVSKVTELYGKLRFCGCQRKVTEHSVQKESQRSPSCTASYVFVGVSAKLQSTVSKKEMSDPNMAKYITSSRGNRLLKHTGYIYCKERNSEPRGHWKCVQYYSKQCRGRAVTLGDSVLRTTDHNHSASATAIEVRESINGMKEIAGNSNDPCAAILREVSQTIPEHVASSMPAIPNLRRIIQRKKQATNPTRITPRTFSDITIPRELSLTVANEPFILYDNENALKRVLIFSTPRNLSRLENSDVWMMDGTFKSTPTPFTQIYTIHGYVNTTVVPLVYSLLPDKQSSTYTEFLSVLKSKMANKSPRKVIMDFELPMLNTISKLYPDTQIQGCFFHFSQAFWRKIQKTSLIEDYASDSKLQFELKKLTALCFVPPHSVDEYYTSITESEYFIANEDKLAPILNYFEDTWIGHLSRSGRRRKPRFLVDWWNCYSTCLEGGAKTNNAIEGWHNSLNTSIGKPHPNFYHFVEILRKEQSYQELRMSQSLACNLNPRLSQRTKEMSTRLLAALKLFPLSVVSDYLASLAHILNSFH
ncbi:uncharacterized protein LOC144781255 [Lissotriton helveticus]